MSSFVHLHVHSEYSLLDGACRVDDLCRSAAEGGAPGVALTDHGVMFGAMEFYYSAREHAVTPIVGCEAYIAPRGRFDRTVRDEAHVTLLAADLVGYRNLTALISKGFLEGYYYKPRIDLDLLAKHNEGLIVLSGCMSGLCAQPLLKNDYEGAKKAAQTYRDIFGDRFYVEIMRHGIPEQEIVNDGLIKLAREMNLPLVATNDSHYLDRTDAPAHDVLLCIGTGKTVADTQRMKFMTDEFYFKSNDEMRALFADVPDACDNTVEIAKRIDIKIPEKQFYLPEYPVPQDAAAPGALPDVLPLKTAETYLREVCERGLVARYGERAANDTALRERFEYELDIITKMGFASYFLIVWDFIKYARDNDIPVGPGRGSAVGSVVSYALRITDLDPLKFNLFFERFLNPERISMPDIDTDFCVERRDEVIDYVTEKYGKDRVAQIVTFGTMAARAAVRDAGRALGVPLPDVDRVAKLIPSGPTGLSIAEALKQIPELKALADGNSVIKKLLETASSIEGLARHASTHAAGVVISKTPLVDYAPLIKLGEGDVNTQYDMGWVEKIGLLKMDFLGLRNLTVMKNAVDEIRRTVNPVFELDTMPDDDKKTLDMLGRGETSGVFQLESDGMRRVVMDLKPSSLDDIIALVALYRPGPMEWIPLYIGGKHGRIKPKYLHPKLEPILRETYGVACLKHDTPVWLADGTKKPISRVSESDTILNYNRGMVHAARVAKVWPSGVKRILRIRLSTGTIVECSEDHRFPTPVGDVQARDLRPNAGVGRVHYFQSDANTFLFEAWARSRNDESLAIGEGRAYLLGLLVGDDSLKVCGTKSICCAAKEDADLIARLCREEFSCETTVRFYTRAWYVNLIFRTTPKPTPLTLWLNEIYGGRSWEQHSRGKCIPQNALDYPERERIALLRGLWDSDGTYAGTGQYFRSTSPRLVAQVAQLLSSLKIAFYVRATAVFVQDRTRFTMLLGKPALPAKRVVEARKQNVMPVLTASLRGRLSASLLQTDLTARKCLKRASMATFTKVVPSSAYLTRIPQFWSAYKQSYEELYLGDARPVFVDEMSDAGEAECFDLQMADQDVPYFLANGVATHNCYQEQVMQMGRDIAGFTMGEADELRKVMGKKQVDKVPIYRAKFIKGAKETNGIDEKLAEEIFKFIEPFAGYGFNKAHAAAYGWIAYQTAYLKANYPLQYFAALLTSMKNNTDKLVEYLEEAKKLGIDVLPPDVNESLVDFAVTDGKIRFGLAAVKGVGEASVRNILEERDNNGKFTDLFDLTHRVDTKHVNRRVLEALTKCGALDSLPGHRAQLMAALDTALEAGSRAALDREMGQASLFGALESPTNSVRPQLPLVSPIGAQQLLAWEKETLGVYISGHPLADIAEALARTGATPLKDLRALEDDSAVTVGGMLTSVRRTVTRAQQQMLIATLEDVSGSVELVVFPKSYPQLQSKFVEDSTVIVKGRLKFRDRRGAAAEDDAPQEINIAVNDLSLFDRSAVRTAPAVRAWHVTVSTHEQVDALASLLEAEPGQTPVVLHAGSFDQPMPRALSSEPAVRMKLEEIFGSANVRTE